VTDPRIPGVGDSLGDYELLARLRSGGMATVFVARRRGAEGFRKRVAIKLVHPHLAHDEQFRRMFIDEATLSARIEHPRCVHIEELREDSGVLYLVMEYVRGGSLSQLMAAVTAESRRLAPALAAHIAGATADGLGAAHDARDESGEPLGVVHRDVSPQNILLSRSGHVKLIDFGVAKARGRAQQTSTGTLKGKFRYMAPEQARGLPLDHRADLYALGIVLWEMLTGRRLFDGDNDLRVLDLVRDPRVARPSRLAPEVPDALDRVVLKALAIDPARRFQHAVQMRRALFAAVPQARAVDEHALASVVERFLPRDGDGVVDIASSSGVAEVEPEPLSNPTRWTLPLGPRVREEDVDARPVIAADVGPAELDASDLISEPPAPMPPPPPARAPRRARLAASLGVAATLVLAGTGLGAVLMRSDAPPPSTDDPEPRAEPPPDAGVDAGSDAGVDAGPPPTRSRAPRSPTSSGARRGRSVIERRDGVIIVQDPF